MKDLVALLDAVLSKPIAFHRIFADVAESLAGGLFLSQMYYWSFRTNSGDGWFYKTIEEWHKETMTTRRDQEVARKILVKKKILEEKKEGIPCKLYYRLNRENLYQEIQKISELVKKTAETLAVNTLSILPNKPDINDYQASNFSQTGEPLMANIHYPENTPEITSLRKAKIKKNQEGKEIAGLEKPELTTSLFSKPNSDQPWMLCYDPATPDETPWLDPPKGRNKIMWHKPFLEWHGMRWMQKFPKSDIHAAIADFRSSLHNDPEKIVVRWEEYQGHMMQNAATVAARLNSGGKIDTVEQNKLEKHSRAFTGATVDMGIVDDRILTAAAPGATVPEQAINVVKPPPELESVATVSDFLWDSIAQSVDEEMKTYFEDAFEGAEGTGMHQKPDEEASSFFKQLHERHQSEVKAKSGSFSPLSPENMEAAAIRDMLANATTAKKLKKVDKTTPSQARK